MDTFDCRILSNWFVEKCRTIFLDIDQAPKPSTTRGRPRGSGGRVSPPPRVIGHHSPAASDPRDILAGLTGCCSSSSTVGNDWSSQGKATVKGTVEYRSVARICRESPFTGAQDTAAIRSSCYRYRGEREGGTPSLIPKAGPLELRGE